MGLGELVKGSSCTAHEGFAGSILAFGFECRVRGRTVFSVESGVELKVRPQHTASMKGLPGVEDRIWGRAHSLAAAAVHQEIL